MGVAMSLSNGTKTVEFTNLARPPKLPVFIKEHLVEFVQTRMSATNKAGRRIALIRGSSWAHANTELFIPFLAPDKLDDLYTMLDAGLILTYIPGYKDDLYEGCSVGFDDEPDTNSYYATFQEGEAIVPENFTRFERRGGKVRIRLAILGRV